MASKLLNKSHKSASRLIPEDNQHITIARIKELLPNRTTIAVTQEIVDMIHRMEDDIDLPQEMLEEDLMSYMYILGNMKGVGLKDLVNAVKYCNLKRHYDNKEAWAITFPDRYNALVESKKQIDNHVSMYTKSKLVTAIDKEMLIPVHLQYAPYFHAAVKKQFELMNGTTTTKGKDGKPDKVSPMVQHLAAKELAVLTKQPEEAKISIDVNPGAEAVSMQQEMNEQLKALVAGQKRRLANGESIIDVQKIDINFDDIVDAEVVK